MQQNQKMITALQNAADTIEALVIHGDVSKDQLLAIVSECRAAIGDLPEVLYTIRLRNAEPWVINGETLTCTLRKAIDEAINFINVSNEQDQGFRASQIEIVAPDGNVLCLQQAIHRYNALPGVTEVVDSLVEVQPVGKKAEWEDWNISLNLSDRWGELNEHNAINKPLAALENDSDLHNRLVAQMQGESTFIVRKDGQFGILFEIEFVSKESEEGEDQSYIDTLKPHQTVVQELLKGMEPLLEKYPGVLFAVPDKEEIVNDRPAAWAFARDGLLSDSQRNELEIDLINL